MNRSKRKQRTLRPRILILCEGQTERNYFQGIKEDPTFKQELSAVQTEVIIAKHPSPDLVIKEAKRRQKEEAREGNPYQEIWVVFDHDQRPNRRKAYEDALRSKFRIAFSAIAFEIWFLLHFKKTAQVFATADKLVQALQQHYPAYQKGKQNDFADLKIKLADALKNAQWLRNQEAEPDKHPTDCNPWTSVDELVRLMTEDWQEGRG